MPPASYLHHHSGAQAVNKLTSAADAMLPDLQQPAGIATPYAYTVPLTCTYHFQHAQQVLTPSNRLAVQQSQT